MGIQTHGQVVGYLAARGHDDAVRVLQFEDIHHALKSQLVEVEAVTHIVGVQRLHAAPVEFDGRAYAVGARAEHDDALAVAQIMHVVFRPAIGQVEVVGLRGILGGQGIYLLHHGQDAAALTVATYLQAGLFDVLVLLHADGAGYLEVGKSLAFGPI